MIKEIIQTMGIGLLAFLSLIGFIASLAILYWIIVSIVIYPSLKISSIPLHTKYGDLYWKGEETKIPGPLDYGVYEWWGWVFWVFIGFFGSTWAIGYVINLLGVSPL